MSGVEQKPWHPGGIKGENTPPHGYEIHATNSAELGFDVYTRPAPLLISTRNELWLQHYWNREHGSLFYISNTPDDDAPDDYKWVLIDPQAAVKLAEQITIMLGGE